MTALAVAEARDEAYQGPVRSGQADIGGDGGLEAVLMRNRAPLLRFIAARGGANDAEDLFHELWLKLSNSPPSGPIADPLAYLYKIADNMMHDRRRGTARRERREAEWIDLSAGPIAEASPVPSVERLLVARDELSSIEGALARLGETTERIFRRFRIDGISQKAIALEHGISLSAVEKHLQRAYRAVIALRTGGDDAVVGERRRPNGEEDDDAAC